MSEPLDPDGLPVQIGPHVTLVSPGLQGEAEVFLPGTAAVRGEEQLTAAFEQALRETGVASQFTIVVRDAQEVPTGSGVTRSTDRGEPAIDVTVPAPADDEVQFLLSVDEAGAATWHLPEESRGGETAMRAAATRRYVVRRRVASDPGPGATRGLLGALGKKVLKVLAFKAVEIVGGIAGRFAMRRWETANRPYRVRSFTADDYASGVAREIGPADWAALSGGPALLFVHGTFSRAHTAFGGLPRDAVDTLRRRYDGRVFAFEHPTASEDPDANATELLRRMPPGVRVQADVVCHSRGGLVSRVLARRGAGLGAADGGLRVRRVVFVAVPNAGTRLADPRHMGDFIDTHTNILSFFPDNGVTDTLEVIISVVKQVAVGALGALDGLQSMNPQGAWIAALNRGPAPFGTEYHAIASNFEPKEPGLIEFVGDRLVDAVFARAPNDLVVPTDGVFAANGAGGFPIADPLVVPVADGIGHSGYFRHPGVVAEILRRLE